MIEQWPSASPARLPGRARYWATAAWAIAAVELRRWRRQPIAVVTALGLPVAVASLVSLALGGEPELRATFAVVDLDRGPVAAAFSEDALGDPRLDGLIVLRRAGTVAEAERLVDGGDADAAIVLPAGATAAVAAGERPDIAVLRAEGPSLGADLAQVVADAFTVRAQSAGLARVATGQLPAEGPTLTVEPVAPGGQALDAASHYGPAIGLLFVMIALGAVAEGQVADRRAGVIARLAATPAPRSAVVVARSGAALGVAGLSFAVTAATMQLAFGRGWGPVTSVGTLVVAVAVAYAGLAAVVAALVRTPGQAQAVTLTLGFVLALASGSFAPPGATVARPPLAGLLPSSLALDGFERTTTEAAGLTTIWPPLVALTAIGAVGVLAASAAARARA